MQRTVTPRQTAFNFLIMTAAAGTLLAAAPVWVETRPRLFFTSERITELKRHVAENAELRQAWKRMEDRADRLLRESLVSKEYAEGGQGQHGNYGRPSSQAAQMASVLGLAYRMTSEKRYAEKVRELLLHFGTLSRWAGDAHWDPPWHSELNTARFCFGYAVGYDAVHDHLSEEDRRQVAGAVIRLGILATLEDWILPEKRIHALDSMGHNWWSVCVAMAGLASLSVLGDDPRAEMWVGRVSRAFPEWFAYAGNVLQNKCVNFDRNGGFYESVGYANYALSEYLLFRLAFTGVFPATPPPAIDELRRTGDFFVAACYPRSTSMLSVNFGDSSLTASGARTVRLLCANGFDSPAYRWYLARTDRGLDDPVGLLFAGSDPAVPARLELPLTALYPDIGWATLRSSWEDETTLLAIKSGYAWNHAHPDAGSFVLFHGGEPLLIDSGNCSYGRPEYSTYYRHSRAHNVVLFNGEAGLPEDCGNGDRGTATPGSIPHLLDAAGLRYVLADATGPTAWRFARNYRHFLWFGPVILIADDVRAHESGRFEWLLHYAGTAERTGSTVRVTNGERATALVEPLFPVELEVLEKKGLADHKPDTEVPYLAFAPTEALRHAHFLTAVVPGPASPPPVLERLQDDEMIGVRVREEKSVTEVYVNLRADGRKMHRNSCHVLGGWETDAAILAVTRPAGADPDSPDAATRYLVAGGSYLRRNGVVMLDSLSKVYSIVASTGGDLVVALEGQPRLDVSLRAANRPPRVLLNGAPVEAPYDTAKRCVRLSTE